MERKDVKSLIRVRKDGIHLWLDGKCVLLVPLQGVHLDVEDCKDTMLLWM